MVTQNLGRLLAPSLVVLVVMLGALGDAAWAQTQQPGQFSMGTGQVPGGPIVRQIGKPNEKLEMTVNTSRILTLKQKIPQAQVNNPDILDLTPLAANQIQISAKKPGVTQVNIWTKDDQTGKDDIYTVDVVVYGDAQELSMFLQARFPNAAIKVIPVGNSVWVAGYVERADDVGRIVQVCEEYYPKVINNITVGGVQQVLLHVKVMEVSRTKLRALGFDFAKITGTNMVVSSVSGILAGVAGGAASGTGDTFSFSIVDPGGSFFGVLEALRQDNLLKILAEPTLVTVSGRPAYFQVGGQFPILVPQSLGTVSVEYKNFGTQVDFVPIVLGNGRIRLEVRPRVSEIDPARGVDLNGVNVPGLRVREVDTGVEMQAGQTLAIAGLVQTRTEAKRRAFPWLGEVPYLGVPFRKVQEQNNEIELVVLVTPQLVDAMDAREVPRCGPGQQTTIPNDHELFFKAYLEVPNCGPPNGGMAPGPAMQDGGMMRGQWEETPGYQQGIPGRTPFRPETAPTENWSRRDTGPAMGRSQLTTNSSGAAEAGNRHIPASRNSPQNATLPGANQAAPGFIGPIGYDTMN